MQAILPAIVWQTRLSASLSLSARTAARNLFWTDQVVKTTGKALAAASASTSSRRFRRGSAGQWRDLIALCFSELALFAAEPDTKDAPDCCNRDCHPGNAD